MAVPNRYQAKAELHFTFGALAVEVHGVITVIFTVSAYGSRAHGVCKITMQIRDYFSSNRARCQRWDMRKNGRANKKSLVCFFNP